MFHFSNNEIYGESLTRHDGNMDKSLFYSSQYIIKTGIASILQDEHLPKAYEINLMEELTLKGITQVTNNIISLLLI